MQGADQEVVGHHAQAAEDAGQNLFLVNGQGEGFANLDVVKRRDRRVHGHVEHLCAWHGGDLERTLCVDARQEVCGHAQQQVDTTGLELEEGRGILLDFTQGQVLDLGGPLVLREAAGPTVVVIAHQLGLLAHSEADQLERAAAHRCRHAELVAQRLVGLRRGDAHEAGGHVEQQTGVRALHLKAHGVVVDHDDLVDRLDHEGVLGALVLGYPPFDHLGVEGLAVMELDATAQFEGPAHAVRRGLPAFSQLTVEGLVGILHHHAVEDQVVGDVELGALDRVVGRCPSFAGIEHESGILGQCRAEGAQAANTGCGQCQMAQVAVERSHGFSWKGRAGVGAGGCHGVVISQENSGNPPGQAGPYPQRDSANQRQPALQ